MPQICLRYMANESTINMGILEWIYPKKWAYICLEV